MRIAEIQQRAFQLRSKSFIRETYREWLNRAPNQKELRYWHRQLLRKVPKSKILQRLLCSPQVKSLLSEEKPAWSGTPSARTVQVLYHLFREPNSEFVVELYQELLGRGPKAEELEHYERLLETGADKWAVFELIALSPEAQSAWQKKNRTWTAASLLNRVFTLNGHAFVAALTRELLARAPMRIEVRRFARMSHSTEGKERVLAALLYSKAFRKAVVWRGLPGGRIARGWAIERLRRLYRLNGANFVTALYWELLDRAPDPQGLHLHVQKLRKVRKIDLIRGVLLSSEANLYRMQLQEQPLAAAQVNEHPEMTNVQYPYAVSVIIPTFKQVEMVQQCVQSLRTTTQNLDYEIIVVDDGSPSEIQARLGVWGEGEGVKVILKPGNDGFSKTVNTGIREARGQNILLVNNDIVFHETGTLDTLLRTMNLAPDIGVVGARLLYPDGEIQHGGIQMTDEGMFEHRFITMPGDYIPAQITDDVIAVTGALMLIRREMVENIGLFCEEYYLAFEDVDYCYLARQEKWRVVYCGEASAIHLEGATRGNKEDPRHELYNNAETNSLRLFQNRWHAADVSPFRDRNVIYVLNSTGVSGGIKVVFEHVNRLHDLGYHVELYSLESSPSWFSVHVPIRVFSNYEEMLDSLKEQDAFKVATWWETAPVVRDSCDPSQGGRGVPFYLVQDMEDNYYLDKPDQQWLVERTYHYTDMHIITEGLWVQGELLRRYNRYAENISLAINQEIFKSRPSTNDNPRSILAISRNGQHLKGFDVTVRAIQRVKQQLPDVQVITFGFESPHIPGITVQHIPLPEDFEVAELYSNCGVFVQTSNHEGFGLPILEAMACGAPVVTTRADGNEEFCQDGNNCVLVNGGDVEAVANGILKVLTDEEFSKRIADNGYRTALRYDWRRVMFNLNNEFAKY